MALLNPTVVFERSKKNLRWYWHLVARNNETFLRCGETDGYPTLSAAADNLMSAVSTFRTERLDVSVHGLGTGVGASDMDAIERKFGSINVGVVSIVAPPIGADRGAEAVTGAEGSASPADGPEPADAVDKAYGSADTYPDGTPA